MLASFPLLVSSTASCFTPVNFHRVLSQATRLALRCDNYWHEEFTSFAWNSLLIRKSTRPENVYANSMRGQAIASNIYMKRTLTHLSALKLGHCNMSKKKIIPSRNPLSISIQLLGRKCAQYAHRHNLSIANILYRLTYRHTLHQNKWLDHTVWQKHRH